MSKARDEYYKYNHVGPDTNISGDYIRELEQRVLQLVDSNVARDIVIKANEQAFKELIGSLSIALDDKRRNLYKAELTNTLNKFKEK